MNLSFSQAAHVISEVSGHKIDRHGIRRQADAKKIPWSWDAGRKVIDSDDAIVFAKKWVGGTRGPKRKNKDK